MPTRTRRDLWSWWGKRTAYREANDPPQFRVGRAERARPRHAPLLSFSFFPASLVAWPADLAASAVFSAALSAPSLTFSPAFFAASFAASPASSIFPLMVSAMMVLRWV